jgi:hypothetical protein
MTMWVWFTVWWFRVYMRRTVAAGWQNVRTEHRTIRAGLVTVPASRTWFPKCEPRPDDVTSLVIYGEQVTQSPATGGPGLAVVTTTRRAFAGEGVTTATLRCPRRIK